MKCSVCSKEIDVKINDVPASWFGIWHASELKKVICRECIRKPEGKTWGEDLK